MTSPDRRTKITMLCAAGAIFAAALIWLFLLERGSYTRKLCTRINSFGYHASPSDLYMQGYGSNTSIRAVLSRELSEAEIEEAVSCSKKAGFSSDVDRTGTVELMLYNVGGSEVMIIYLTDKEPELIFLENRSEGSVSPIGER